MSFHYDISETLFFGLGGALSALLNPFFLLALREKAAISRLMVEFNVFGTQKN